MKKGVINKLVEITGEDWVDTDCDRVKSYSTESTNESYGMVTPEPVEGSVVVKPENAEEISQIMKYANEELTPVIVKGGGTGLSANAIPTEPSIIISMERMNKKIEIDEENLMVVCDAAVTLGELIEELNNKAEKIYFPVHPGDEGAHVGGMVIMNAGGVRAVKHGIMRKHVMGMKVVMPTGEIVEMGGKLLKNNSGYDLMHLLVGSEGTLGVVTEVTLKLYPRLDATGSLVITFDNRIDAIKTVPKILQEGLTPLAIEYVERGQISMTADDLGQKWPAEGGVGDLYIIMEEENEDDLYDKAMQIEQIAQNYNAKNTLIAETIDEQRNLLEIRSHILPAIQDDIVDIPDVTVPKNKLGDYLTFLDELAEEYDTEIPIVAHAGDGNLHACIMQVDGEIPTYYDELKERIYKKALEMGGTITGEHGIGLLRKKFLDMQFTDKELEIMWQIKKAFDPNNILNPGKSVKEMQ